MKITKAIIKLILSVILQLLLVLPRVTVWAINFVKTILDIASRTISFLIEQIEEEVKIKGNEKEINKDSHKT